MSKVLHFIGLLVVGVFCCGAGSSDCITKDGYFRGVKLAGKVRVVEAGADFKVRIVNGGEDLRVCVDSRASHNSNPGRWRFVSQGEDFKVRFVMGGEDFKVKFDEHTAGVKNPCKEKQRPR